MAGHAAGSKNLREVLLRTDRDFAATAARLGPAEAFALYAAPDAVMLPSAGEPVRGREAVRRHLQSTDGTDLAWTPSDGSVSASGDLGYTWGFFEVRRRGDKAGAALHRGKYVSIWQRQSDGSWKWVLDAGNVEP